jgi:hypothetical protein
LAECRSGGRRRHGETPSNEVIQTSLQILRREREERSRMEVQSRSCSSA